MALIGFQKQFAPDVECGIKTQTIRALRKNRIKVGEILYLYGSLRTKQTRKLNEVVCQSVDEVRITVRLVTVKDNEGKFTHYNCLEYLDQFAKDDGFEGWNEMVEWFTDNHGLPFTGVLIKW